MSTILLSNHYGKSRVRMVKVVRHDDRHDLMDVTVNIQIEGDFEAVHTAGDNRNVLPTDTMKNTVYALAKQSPQEQIEDFARRLTDHFLTNLPQVSQVRIEIAEHPWTRMGRHAFTRGSNEKRIASIAGTRNGRLIMSGIEDLVVLKTTGSAFAGYIQDKYTTLKETSDRILVTAIKATWIHGKSDIDFGPSWVGVRKVLLDTFAERESPSVQHTAYAMGEAVLKAYPAIEEVSLSLPNKHCLLVDLSPFGMENNNEIFLPVDEPHGLIEVAVRRSP